VTFLLLAVLYAGARVELVSRHDTLKDCEVAMYAEVLAWTRGWTRGAVRYRCVRV
jgi:ubiquinone biosynthesis protein UbiJ